MKHFLALLFSLLLFSCNKEYNLVKNCIECVKNYSKQPNSIELLHNIEVESPRPWHPWYLVNIKTLEERLNLKLNPDLTAINSIDTSSYYFSKSRLRIQFKLKIDKHHNIILNKIEDLQLTSKKTIIKLIKSMCSDNITELTIEKSLLEFGYEILKIERDLNLGWYKGEPNNIQFNCQAGSKRLLYTIEPLDSSKLESGHYFFIKENWYFYDNKLDNVKNKTKRINKIRRKNGW